MLWIAVHMPQLSLESFAATVNPAWRDRPMALTEAHRVTQVDARAARLGIQPGAKRATALALAGDLVLGQVDPARDAQALQAAAYAALSFTPMVCAQACDSTGAAAPVVLLEVQASLRFFRGLPRLVDRLRRVLHPLGHGVQIASAPTALGAGMLARWRSDLVHGTHSADLGALQRLLDDAPVWLLGPGREHWEALQGMGLRQLSDLRHLPRAGLARRFGRSRPCARRCTRSPRAHRLSKGIRSAHRAVHTSRQRAAVDVRCTRVDRAPAVLGARAACSSGCFHAAHAP
jgi:protein ImuB